MPDSSIPSPFVKPEYLILFPASRMGRGRRRPRPMIPTPPRLQTPVAMVQSPTISRGECMLIAGPPPPPGAINSRG